MSTDMRASRIDSIVGDFSASSAGASLALVGRIALSAIFLHSGIGKLGSPEGTIAYIASGGLPLPEVAYGLAVLVEVAGGLALVLGYQARLAAAALAVFTLVAALFFHNDFADQNQFIHFMKNVATVGGLLQVVAFGAGRYSLDARRARRTLAAHP